MPRLITDCAAGLIAKQVGQLQKNRYNLDYKSKLRPRVSLFLRGKRPSLVERLAFSLQGFSMNVERPMWSAWTAADPLAGALRSIFQPPDNIPPNLVKLLDDVHGVNWSSAQKADRPG